MSKLTAERGKKLEPPTNFFETSNLDVCTCENQYSKYDGLGIFLRIWVYKLFGPKNSWYFYYLGTLVNFLFVIWLDVESNHVHLDAIDAAGNFFLQKSQKFFFKLYQLIPKNDSKSCKKNEFYMEFLKVQ